MQDKFKVPVKNIYVVASSGLPRPPNRDALVKVIKDKTGKDLRTIDANAEVMLTILGVVPSEHRATSVLVDIGSGNTKGGYLEKGAKAVIDMQEELRNQALKLFSGFPYAANAENATPEAEKPHPKGGKGGAKKPRGKK